MSTSTPILANLFLGNSTEQPQWESSNAGSSFPFEDNSLPAGFPTDVVVDACIVVPRTESDLSRAPARVELGCLHASASLLSVLVLVDGKGALAKSVSSTYEPYTPVPLDSLDGKCSGMVTFGNARALFGRNDRPVTVRERVPFSEGVIARPLVGRLRRFLKVRTGATASGDVGMVLPDGVAMSIENVSGASLSQVWFSMTEAARSALKWPCTEEAGAKRIPISSINGVRPDSQGRIAIVFGKAD